MQTGRGWRFRAADRPLYRENLCALLMVLTHACGCMGRLKKVIPRFKAKRVMAESSMTAEYGKQFQAREAICW